uniref:DZIP3-like HEPN domain-containing protein n=1 Tax=Clytia hemisphaerica TaxID=252671 RepID=A0A7M5WV34_9CNID
MSTPLYILQSEYWVRINLALEYCIKEVLIDVLHNVHNDTSYTGLPTCPKQLYQIFVQCKQNKKHELNKVLKKEQWEILCPQNGSTNPEDWDITLLIAVLRSVVGLQPAGGWKIKSLQPNDQSIGAFLFLIRNLRNELMHGSINAVSNLQAFKQLRSRMENILLGLKYKNMQMFYDLESCPLDKHVLVISRMVTNLDQEVDLLRNEASDNSNAIKNIEQTNQWIKTYLKQLSSAKADKTDVEDLAKSMNMKADKDEIDELSTVMDSKLTLKADKFQIDDLSNKVDQLSMETKSIKGKALDTTKTHWNLPEPVSIFFGRENLIESIHLKLQQNQAIALSEMGGVGKTQTAAKFPQIHKDEYQKIFWISAVSLKKSLNEILCAFGCKQLILDEPSMETLAFIFLSKICEGSKGSLVVLDDVTDVTKDVTLFIRIVKEKISLLLTSQLRDWEDYGLIQIAVPCFHEQESIGFLQNELTTASHQEISILANRLQSLPLALHQAICYIKKHKVPLHRYIEQFEACRESVLGIKITSFTEYDKTLLTVWDMAFAKIRVESNNALLILGMMAFMDNRKINKKTFSYFDKVDEFELNEIINLLCQYSLVNEWKDCLEIHNLVQKVIRYRIEQKQFVEDESPLTLLESVLLKIEGSVEDLVINADQEDLWYIHVFRLIMSGALKTIINFDVSLLLNIAIGRLEMENLYQISELLSRVLLKQYRLFRDVETFHTLLLVHHRFINASIHLGLLNLNEIFAFEEEFSSELEENHVEVYWWKLQQAQAYNIRGRVSLCKDIVQNLFNELVKKKGFDDVKLRLASFLSVRDIEVLFNSVDTDNLSDADFLVYYDAKCSLYVKNGCFDLAEQVLKDWKEHIHRKQFSRMLHFNFTKRNCFLLYKKGNYNEALLACDELKRDSVFTDADVFIWEALILIKLGKFNDAELLLDDFNQCNNAFIIRITSYLKFRKHDFEAVENLLTNVEDEDLSKILFFVKEYAKLHRQFENNKSREMVEQCLQMKKIVNELFQVELDSIDL